MTNILEATSEKAVILFLAAFVVFSVASIQGALWFIPDKLGIVMFLGLLIGM
ncbi:MAG: hypothetical protein ACXAEN_24815 [Candidatus Thorarchaeota archaeon]|jgi:hypothetical protein